MGKSSSNVKQVIVMRRDLNMRKGKMVAQGAHASLGALLQMFSRSKKQLGYRHEYYIGTQFQQDSVLDRWLNGKFTKICVYVNSEQELLDLYERVYSNSKMPVALIEDAGLTEFNGVKTKTCIGIGPWDAKEIDKFTGNLPLL